MCFFSQGLDEKKTDIIEEDSLNALECQCNPFKRYTLDEVKHGLYFGDEFWSDVSSGISPLDRLFVAIADQLIFPAPLSSDYRDSEIGSVMMELREDDYNSPLQDMSHDLCCIKVPGYKEINYCGSYLVVNCQDKESLQWSIDEYNKKKENNPDNPCVLVLMDPNGTNINFLKKTTMKKTIPVFRFTTMNDYIEQDELEDYDYDHTKYFKKFKLEAPHFDFSLLIPFYVDSDKRMKKFKSDLTCISHAILNKLIARRAKVGPEKKEKSNILVSKAEYDLLINQRVKTE